MKNINHQEIILDIEKRIKFFNEIRINKIVTADIESIQEIKSNDFVDKKSRSTIVKEDLITKDVFEKREKIDHFTKKEDFVLKDSDKYLVKQKKEATNNFFKTISNFFDGKSNEIELINAKQDSIEEMKTEKKAFKSKKQ